jgi:pyruvate/2-oxoglutarate dehydrogenase complex dihydrolipoamide acyltransferase (E2) component
MAAAANAKRSASMAAVHAAKKQKVDAGAGMGAGAGGVLQEAEVPEEAAAPKAEEEAAAAKAEEELLAKVAALIGVEMEVEEA